MAILFGYTDGQTDYLEFGPKTGGKVVWQFFIFTISFFFALPSSSEFEISPAERKTFTDPEDAVYLLPLSPLVLSKSECCFLVFFANLSFLFAFVANDDQNQHIIKLNSLRGGGHVHSLC